MYEIILAIYQKFLISGAESFEFCLNFAIGTEYYNLLEQYSPCNWHTLPASVTTTMKWIVHDVVYACDIDSLIEGCYYHCDVP